MRRTRHDSPVRGLLVCCAIALAVTIFSRSKQLGPTARIQGHGESKPQLYMVPVYLGVAAGIAMSLLASQLNPNPIYTLVATELIFVAALIPWAIAGFSRRFREWKWPVTAPLGAAVVLGAWLTTFSQKGTELLTDFNWGPLSAGLSILTFVGSIAVALDIYLRQDRRNGPD